MSDLMYKALDRKVVIVSDNTELLSELEFLVASESFQYSKFDSRLSAVTHIKTTMPELIIVDLDMKANEAFKLANRFRRYKKYERIYWIFLQSNDTNQKSLKSLNLNNDILINKPIDTLHLKQVIKECLHLI